MSDNPFEKPNILDRKVEVFTACDTCNVPFIDKAGKENFGKEWKDDVIRIVCNNCNSEYKFKNWNKGDRLGIWRNNND